MRKKLLSILCCVMTVASLFSFNDINVEAANSSFVKGVDISSIIAFEDSGVTFKYANGNPGDIFDILKDAGVNYVRIRVWNNPYSRSGAGYGGGNNDLYKAKLIGQRATRHGMKCMIDFQYSDFWADPSKQYAPKDWKNFNVHEKGIAIYNYTYDSLKTLIDAGVDVGMVQIGNETQGSLCGMGGLYDGTWDLSSGVANGLKNGCWAVDDINSYYGKYGSNKILKVVHFTDLNTTASWYAEQLKKQNVNYDVFAVSAYPFWHGAPSDLKESLKSIAKTYNKKVMVAETAYPYTFDNSDSQGNNIGSKNDMSFSGYDVSVRGQEQAILAVMDAVYAVNNQSGTSGYGLGGFYWEPTWIGTSTGNCHNYGTGFASAESGNYELMYNSKVSEYSLRDCGSSWDNMALFDRNGKALDSLQLFNHINH